jgi:3-oxoacyl-[acyl-carrier-protein] synthase-3
MSEIKAKISGVGAYVPEDAYTNFDIEELLGTSDEWIQQRTGIVKRHWAKPHVSTSDLALKASLEAIENADLEARDIDMIIFATLSPDHEFPGNGCFLQHKLGLTDIPAFDIRQQCSGFVYGLSMANCFIKSGQYKNILLVGAELHSKGLDLTPRGRDVAVLFGDGAGAAIISESDDDGELISFDLHAQGEFAKELWVSAPGYAIDSKERINEKMLKEGLHYPQMNGRTVFAHAVKRMSESLTNTLKKNSLAVSDIDLFLFHQANLRINDKVGEYMGIDADQVFNTIQDYGNTTAATIPIGMRDAMKAGKLKKGMTVGLAAFGAGFTWGSGILKF